MRHATLILYWSKSYKIWAKFLHNRGFSSKKCADNWCGPNNLSHSIQQLQSCWCSTYTIMRVVSCNPCPCWLPPYDAIRSD